MLACYTGCEWIAINLVARTREVGSCRRDECNSAPSYRVSLICELWLWQKQILAASFYGPLTRFPQCFLVGRHSDLLLEMLECSWDFSSQCGHDFRHSMKSTKDFYSVINDLSVSNRQKLSNSNPFIFPYKFILILHFLHSAYFRKLYYVYFYFKVIYHCWHENRILTNLIKNHWNLAIYILFYLLGGRNLLSVMFIWKKNFMDALDYNSK